MVPRPERVWPVSITLYRRQETAHCCDGAVASPVEWCLRTIDLCVEAPHPGGLCGPWLPDMDPGFWFEPQLVGSADIKGAVELVEVPHDLVAAELAGGVRVGGEQPECFLVPGPYLPDNSPR